MVYNPKIHHRRSIWLKGYDYSKPGVYSVTICVQNRKCLFGEIVDKNMILNDAGKMVEKWYFELENKYPNMMDWFKTMTTNEYIRGVKTKNWPRFEKRLWQLRYWDRIIWNEQDYTTISNYIINNPAKWDEDKFRN